MRTRVLTVFLAVTIVVLPLGDASSSSEKAFTAYLNGLQMDCVLPMMAMKDVFVGGLVVAKGKNADFHGLPNGVTQPTVTGGDPENFPAESSKTSLSLSIALNALFGWAIGGNLSHSKNLDITQITATFYKSNDNSSALADPKTQADIKDLIQRQHLKVYQIQSLSTTKAIKFTTSGSIGAGISVAGGNGTNAKSTDCASSSSGNQGNGSQGTNNGTPTSPGAKENAAQTQPTNTPGGSAQLCTSSDNTLSLTTTDDLVFAVKLYAVTLNKDTNTYVANAIPGHAGSGPWSDLMNSPVGQLKENDVRTLKGASAGLNTRWTSKKYK